MDREQSIAFLNRVLHETVNSVVQYIEVAMPYMPAGCEGHREAIAKIREEQGAQAHALTGLIEKLDGVPKVGTFPYWNVDLNYLDLRWLAGFAARHEEKAIAGIEAGLPGLRADPLLYGTLKGIAEQKRAHVARLLEAAKRPPPPAPSKPAAAPPKSHH